MTTLAVILAGGEGRRMGGQKPLRPWGEATLLANALRLGRIYADEVAVAVRDPTQVGEVDAPLIFDDLAIEGPLAGLAGALAHGRARRAEWVITLPCDMPRLPDNLAERLAAALAAAPGSLAAAPIAGGELHPVCGLWRPAALDRMAGYVVQGSRSLRGFAALCGFVPVTWPASAAELFANANTPQELDSLRAATDG